MVMVDARSEYVDARTSPAEARGFKNLYAFLGNVYKAARSLGLMRLIGANVVGAPTLSLETRTAMALIGYAPRSQDAGTAEAIQRAASDALLAAAPSLGHRPLIVLASEANMTNEPNWPEAQQLLAEMSTQGRLIVPAGSSHYIHWDHPAVVIEAVTEVVGRVRASE
jgi:pimeloyl-ACP methyl ester carboxylesterase